jgi:hypothetical protein
MPIPGVSKTGRTKLHTFFRVLTRVPAHARPRVVDGIVETYCTPYVSLTAEHLPTGQRAPHPAFSLVPTRIRQYLHRRALIKSLAQTVEQESAIHYWTHLWELANETQFPPIESFLKYVREQVEREALRVKPMSALPAMVEDT